MSPMWQRVQSFFTGGIPSRMLEPSRVSVVAIVGAEQDRQVLASIPSFDVHFVDSYEKAHAVANHIAAPVILVDRDWPSMEWRAAVEKLSVSPHFACIILLSGVADDYLWQELIRRGGYDVLPKPLLAENVSRVVKLALSYRRSHAGRSGVAAGRT